MWKTRYTNLLCHSAFRSFESKFYRPVSLGCSCAVHGKNFNIIQLCLHNKMAFMLLEMMAPIALGTNYVI
jgi:hypothetical protein